MMVPKFDGLDALEDDMNATEKAWAVWETFSTELDAIATQDWITFRSRLYELADFNTKWINETKNKTLDLICGHIFDEMEVMKKALPGLKFCKGD